MRLAALTCTMWLALGCRQPTEVMVGIDTDLRTPDTLDEIQIVAQRDGKPKVEFSWKLDAERSILPGTVGLSSSAVDGRPVTLSVVGKKDGREVLSRSARLPLSRGRVLQLPMHLLARCVGISCQGATTCNETGACVTIDVDPSSLSDSPGGICKRSTIEPGLDEMIPLVDYATPARIFVVGMRRDPCWLTLYSADAGLIREGAVQGSCREGGMAAAVLPDGQVRVLLQDQVGSSHWWPDAAKGWKRASIEGPPLRWWAVAAAGSTLWAIGHVDPIGTDWRYAWVTIDATSSVTLYQQLMGPPLNDRVFQRTSISAHDNEVAAAVVKDDAFVALRRPGVPTTQSNTGLLAMAVAMDQNATAHYLGLTAGPSLTGVFRYSQRRAGALQTAGTYALTNGKAIAAAAPDGRLFVVVGRQIGSASEIVLLDLTRSTDGALSGIESIVVPLTPNTALGRIDLAVRGQVLHAFAQRRPFAVPGAKATLHHAACPF